MPKIAFLFDLDGVLVDTKDLHWKSWQIMTERHEDFHMNYSEFIMSFGKTNQYILEELLPEISDAKRKLFSDEKEAVFRSLPIDNLKLLPGVKDFINQIDQKKIPKIIASSTPVENLDALLEKTKLGNYFNSYVSAEQVKRGKPFPDVFLEAAKRVNTLPEHSIVIEDSLAGIKAGKDAGCRVIAVTTTLPRSQLKDYDFCVDQLDELSLEELEI